MAAYYNEIDPFAAEWLENLVAKGQIAPGDVDRRSIADVCPDDLRGYVQVHFFAGIGGWSYALKLSGWPDDKPVWTGSCPCQPFSSAGKRKGFDDDRHLWPIWFKLIKAWHPPTIFGEQVAAAIQQGWLDTVFADLETENYSCGAAVLPACSVGAPHIRQRLWFVADALHSGRPERRTGTGDGQVAGRGVTGRLADNGCDRPQDGRRGNQQLETEQARSERDAAERSRCSPWADLEWLPCTDGKARPVEPGTFPLAHGIPSRVGRLRAYGNAIIPQVAAKFIKASE